MTESKEQYPQTDPKQTTDQRTDTDNSDHLQMTDLPDKSSFGSIAEAPTDKTELTVLCELRMNRPKEIFTDFPVFIMIDEIHEVRALKKGKIKTLALTNTSHNHVIYHDIP